MTVETTVEEVAPVLSDEEQAALDNAGVEPVEKVEDTPEEEAPEEETPEDEPEEEATEYEEYSDPAGRQIVNILKNAKLSVKEANDIFKTAAETGDLSKVNRATLEAKLGKEQTEVVLVLAKSYYDSAVAELAASMKMAHEMVGGEETFAAMQAWAKAQTKPEVLKEIKELREMFDTKKPKAIKAAIKEWHELYKADPTTTVKAKLHVGDKSPAEVSTEGLTRSEYAAACLKARRNGTYEKESAGLWARRQAAMKQGK